MESICAIGRYNEQPMVTLWNTMFQFKDVDYMGTKPVLELLQRIEQEGKVNEFLQWSGENSQIAAYASTAENLLPKWGAMIGLLLIAVAVAVISLEFIDRTSGKVRTPGDLRGPPCSVRASWTVRHVPMLLRTGLPDRSFLWYTIG